MRLSEAFANENSNLELKVKVYNINAGSNRGLIENCQYLRNYAIFVERVKSNQQRGLNLSDAIN